MAPTRKPPAPRAKRPLKAIEKIDIDVASSVALDETSFAGRWIARFAELGDQPPLRMLCGATIVAGVLRHDPRLRRSGMRMALAHSIATLAKAFVKDGVDRTRPSEALKTREYRLKPGQSDAHGLTSMPSGHSAGVAAVVASVIADYPAAATPALVAGGAVLGAQLPSRNHFISDVAAGSAIGMASFGLALLLLPVAKDEAD